MLTVQALDVIPLYLLFILSVLALLASMEIGYRLMFFQRKSWGRRFESGPIPPITRKWTA